MLGKNVTIIGGSGGMGKVFGKFFKDHGFNVIFYARNELKLKEAASKLKVKYELSLEKSVKNADIVMISIPISSTTAMIRKIGPFLKKNTIVFDITSLKYAVFKALTEIKEKYPVNCISLHPMFGPGITDMKNYVMMVVKVGGTNIYEEIINELLNLFASDGLIVTETLPEIHDKRVALTLGVPHMFNILFLSLLRSTNEPLNELTRFTGTTFLLQKVFAESIIQREMEMFGEIQMENQEFLKILEIFEDLLHRYKKIIEEKNVVGFNEIFSQGLDYSKEDNHFRNSYRYFYEFMKILKRELQE